MGDDQVFIRDLRVRAVIGVYDHERVEPQNVVVNIQIGTDLRIPGQTDEIAVCIDYAVLTDQITSHIQQIKRYTVEALAEDIAQICLKERGAAWVKVRVEKPDALAAARGAGVEIHRRKSV